MFSLNDAYEALKREHSDDKLASCLDIGDYYAFKFVPKDAGDDYIDGLYMEAISKKDGSFGIFNIIDNLELYDNARNVTDQINIKHSLDSIMQSALDDYDNDHLEHHGILGMKWGIRRFQNKDGSLTSQGKKRYNTGKAELSEDAKKLKKSDKYNDLKTVHDAWTKSYDKLYKVGVNGKDFDDEYEYVLPTASKEFKDALKENRVAAKNYNDELDKIAFDQQTKNRINNALNEISKNEEDETPIGGLLPNSRKSKSESNQNKSQSSGSTPHTLTAAEAVRNIPVNKLTNQQLKDATDRMNLESNYRRALSEYNKVHMTTGEKLKNYANKQFTRELDRQISKITDSLADDATKKLLSKYGVEVSGGKKKKKK